jgi:hypothetical protein
MPLVKGRPDRHAQNRRGASHTQQAADAGRLIMSGFLLTSSFVTTVLIPQQNSRCGGEANGERSRFLATRYLGSGIRHALLREHEPDLWFRRCLGDRVRCGARLLNIVPRYLPRYGMAPDWKRPFRPFCAPFFYRNRVRRHHLVQGRRGWRRAAPTPRCPRADCPSFGGPSVTIAAQPRRRSCAGATTTVFVRGRLLYTTGGERRWSDPRRPGSPRSSSVDRGDVAHFLPIWRSTELRTTEVVLDPKSRPFHRRCGGAGHHPHHRQPPRRPHAAPSTS